MAEHQRKETLISLDQYKNLLVKTMTIRSKLNQAYEVLVEAG
ncbi:hypothetical protein [Enterococcus sp. DIV1420a]